MDTTRNARNAKALVFGIIAAAVVVVVCVATSGGGKSDDKPSVFEERNQTIAELIHFGR